MLERFKNYFGKLERLSDGELDRSAEKLVCAEKQNVAKLIAHIAEMSRLKVALELGYKSTFHYCVERLHLSEGSVASRIHVANVSIRFPQLLVALAENRISLTVAGLLAPHLSEDNVDTLLADCAGMTKKAVLEYLVRIEPKPVFEPSIRRRPAQPVPVEAAPAERPAPPPRELTQSKRQLSPGSLNILQPAPAHRVQFQVLGRPKLQREVRATGRSHGCRECSKAYGGDLGAGSGRRPRQKRPKEEARTAEGEAKGHQGQTSSGGDVGRCRAGRAESERQAGQVAIHSFRGHRALTNANIKALMGGDVGRGPAFRWSTNGRLPSFAATTSNSLLSCARPTTDWRPNMSTGWNSSNGRFRLYAHSLYFRDVVSGQILAKSRYVPSPEARKLRKAM